MMNYSTLTAKKLLDYLLRLAETKDLDLIPLMFIEGDVAIQAQVQHLAFIKPKDEEDILTFVTQCEEVLVLGSIPNID